ncbi:MAG: DUF418 domain-containing protein [Segetibacter sp.]
METIPAYEIATATDSKIVQTAVPVIKKDRFVILDCIRGIALLGILIMNITSQSQPHFFYDSMNLNQPLTGPNFYVWAIMRFFFEGTMRGLFSILFGAGAILLLMKLEKQKEGLEPADIYYRRMLWLLVFGLINAFVLLWPGDILYPYAIAGLLLFPFRNWSYQKLLCGALFFLAIATYKENSSLKEDKETITKGRIAESLDSQKKTLTGEQKEDLGKWKTFKERSTAEGMMKEADKELKKVQGKSYLDIFRYYRDIIMRRQSFGVYNFSFWDTMIFFFIGMALFKTGFIMGKSNKYLYVAIAVVGIGVGLTMNYFVLQDDYYNRFDYLKIVEKLYFNHYEIRRVFQTLGYLSLLILMYKFIPFKKVMNIFAPVGQMAFTNYLMQSIITSVIFYGFAYYGKLQRYEIYYIVAAIWVFQLVFSAVWLRYFSFGPFEWIWRSLTYQRFQPFRKPRQEKIFAEYSLT